MTETEKQVFKEESIKGRSLWSDGIRRLRRRTLPMLCLVVIILYFSLATFVYLAEAFSWDVAVVNWSQQVGQSYQGPSTENIFGTDIFGQSVLRKTLYGAKISITVALCASLISLAIGIPLGAIAGYFGEMKTGNQLSLYPKKY